jgi:GNAT superfamily N-acetyltransferase
MWVAPAASGLGIGRRLLSELEGTAREVAVVVLRLETNRALSEAIHFTNVQVISNLRRSMTSPTPTIGSKKRLGRKRKVGECSNRD